MSIERAERLKKELTDKWVVVADGVPELKRFAKFTGQVKTVNMNCRALVQFDGPVDIGWYDIDPGFLTVVDGPRPKAAPAKVEKPEKAPSAPKAAPAAGGGSPLDKIRAAGGAAKPSGGGSPLDKIRAAGGAGAAAAPKATGGSPLDKIRAAGAAGASAAEPAATQEQSPAPAPPAAAKPSAPAAGGSPLDRIRAMGAAKKDD
ncbi:MAG: hypothetical protein KDA91_10015 [Planctomycetaceae bacterium]|nr:hypothetical protein [Planctomycetaceae bacterium]